MASFDFPCDVYGLEDEIGEIEHSETECPGVCYVSAMRPEDGIPIERYIIDPNTASLSEAAKQYGKPMKEHPKLLEVVLGEKGSGDAVITYEIFLYKKRNRLPLPEGWDLLTTAVYGRENYPEYFGRFPAPMVTPYGETTRYLELMNGVFLLETETAQRLIAVCYPMWGGDISKYSISFAIEDRYAQKVGLQLCHPYRFFREDTGCAAMFELWRLHPQLAESGRIDYPALLNALWTNHPQYAMKYNAREITGENDQFGMLLRSLGMEDVELHSSRENLISISPDAGTDYLKW